MAKIEPTVVTVRHEPNVNSTLFRLFVLSQLFGIRAEVSDVRWPWVLASVVALVSFAVIWWRSR